MQNLSVRTSKVDVRAWDGSGALHKNIDRPLKRKLPAGGEPNAKKQKLTKNAKHQKELEERKTKSLARAKEIIFKIFPRKVREVEKSCKDLKSKSIKDILGENHDHLKPPPAEFKELRNTLKDELIYLLSLLEELEIFLVDFQPILEEQPTFGEQVQYRIRATISMVSTNVFRYLCSLPSQSQYRASALVRMRKRPGLEDCLEGLKSGDEDSVRTLRNVNSKLLILYCTLYDIFEKNWKRLVEPDALRKQYHLMIV